MFGSHSNLYLAGRPAAVKTGTTQEYRDGWTVGYTPSLVAGVWAGNNDSSSMRQGDGSYVAAPIWNEFMKRAYELRGAAPQESEGQPLALFTLPNKIEEFTSPEPITTGKPILNGQFAFERKIKIDKREISQANFYVTVLSDEPEDEMQKPILINNANSWDGKVKSLLYKAH